jgi:hypothetical protein
VLTVAVATHDPCCWPGTFVETAAVILGAARYRSFVL